MLPGIQDCAFYKPIAHRDSANADHPHSQSANGSALSVDGAGGGSGFWKVHPMVPLHSI